MHKYIIIFLFFISIVFIVYSQGPAEQEEIYDFTKTFREDEERVIKIAGDLYYPPFSYVDDKNQFTGFSIDILNAISKKTGLSFHYIPMKYYQAEEALRNGTVDLIMGMKFTASNNKSFEFSDPYFTMSESIVVPKENNEIIQITDLKYKVVSIQDQQSLYDILFNVRRTELLISTSSYDAIQLLDKGRADAYLGNQWTAKYYLKKLGLEDDYKIIATPVQPGDFSIVARKGEKEILEKVNQGLKEIRMDGTFEEIYYDWFSESLPLLLKKLQLTIIILVSALLIAFIIFIASIIWNRRLQKLIAINTKELREVNRELASQQKEIAESNLFKETVLNDLRSGIITFDNRLQITYINNEMKEMFEDQERVPLNLMKEILLKTLSLQNDKKAYLNRELIIEENGIKKYYDCDLIPINQINNLEVGWIFSVQDRTEERMLHQKLGKQEKLHALGQLLAGIAHELRNPLYSIKTFIELLPKQYDDPEFRAEISHHVPAELTRMNHLIEDLLDYSRQKPSKKVEFEVTELLDSILLLFKQTFIKEDIYLVKKIEKCTIYADPTQIKQVIINLFLNGMEAMARKETKEIFIEVTCRNSYTTIIIEDTGVGISPEGLSKIFEPFYSTKATGVGLGLFISHKIIEENNGEIEFTSREGQGTRVMLRFDAQAAKVG